MSDFGDDDYDDYDLDYDYIYVEDEFGAAVSLRLNSESRSPPTDFFRRSDPLLHCSSMQEPVLTKKFWQDDLAEHAIASPPYTFYEYEAEQDNYDPYAYFNDIEYTSDGYFDDVAENGKLATPNRLRQKNDDAPSVKTGQKRKAASPANRSQPAKKARVASQETLDEDLPPTVVWVPWNERPGITSYTREGKDAATTGPFALLADWRDRIGKFKPETGNDKALKELEVPKPEEDAEEDGDDGSGENVYGDVDGDGEDDEAVDEEAFQAHLKKALGEKLAASGMGEGMDQATLLQYAMRMLSAEGDSDDIAGELATNLLGRATEGPEAAGISQWLGQQGVNLEDEAEDEGDEEGEWQTEDDEAPERKFSMVTSPPPSLPNAQRPPTPSSTRSSSGSGSTSKSLKVAEIRAAPAISNPVVPVIRGGAGSAESSAPKSRKRKAQAPQQRKPDEQEEDPVDQPPPAKRVASYAAPTTSSQNKATSAAAQSARTRTRNTGKKP